MSKPIDRGIFRARLAAAKNDTGVFAAAYREHVPALLEVIDAATGSLLDVETMMAAGHQLDCPRRTTEPTVCACHLNHALLALQTIQQTLTLLGLADVTSRDAARAKRPPPTILRIERPMGVTLPGFVFLSDGTDRRETEDEFAKFLNDRSAAGWP